MAQSAAARLGRRTVVAVAVLAVVSGATAQIAQAAPPANDNFGAATVISTAPTTVVGTNAEATRQTNEPTNGEQTVWWRWTAPDSGRYRLDLCQTTPEWAAVLSVYTGTAVASLTKIAQSTNGGECDQNNMEVVTFDAVAGTIYRFSVGSRFSGESSANIRLSLRRTPLNDNFAAAAAFEPVPGTVVGDNTEATRETGEPETGNRTLWWKWTAPDSGRYRLDTCQTVPAFGSVLAIHTGDSVSSLVEVARTVNGSECETGGMEVVTFDALAGTTYRFSVGTSSSDEPSSNIRLSLRRTPLNDNFAAAFDFPAQGILGGSNLEATRETGEPDHGYYTVWWRWTAPRSGKYRLDTCETLPVFSGTLAVYIGGAVSSLGRVDTESGNCASNNGMDLLSFEAAQGTTYHFVVGGASSSSTRSENIKLRLLSVACINAAVALERAAKAAAKAAKATSKAKSALKKANKALKNAKSRNARRAAAKKVAAAKKKLKSAKSKQKKAKAALATATKNYNAACL